MGAYAQAIVVGEALAKGNRGDVKFVMKMGMCNLFVDRIVFVGIHLLSIKHLAQLLSYGDDVIDEVIQANGSVFAMFLLFGLDEYLARGILISPVENGLKSDIWEISRNNEFDS